jgi:hypothetical protein
MGEPFEILGAIQEVETIAAGKSVRSRKHLAREYGSGRWRKMKGAALIRYLSGRICRAELHWYEAHGRGRFAFKVKRELD